MEYICSSFPSYLPLSARFSKLSPYKCKRHWL